MALVAFDDFPWADLFAPRLTVMAQPIADLARTAVGMVLARLEDPDAAPVITRLDPTFRHRDSCGCA